MHFELVVRQRDERTEVERSIVQQPMRFREETAPRFPIALCVLLQDLTVALADVASKIKTFTVRRTSLQRTTLVQSNITRHTESFIILHAGLFVARPTRRDAMGLVPLFGPSLALGD